MAATYTIPRTWTAGELVTAALLNTQLRDNLDYLKARPVARFADLDGTVTSTTSTTFVDLTGASVNITTSGTSRLLIMAHVVWQISVATLGTITAVVDGVNQGDATQGIVYQNIPGSTRATCSFQFVTSAAVSDGAHTVKLQYKVDGASTLTINQVNLVVMEVF